MSLDRDMRQVLAELELLSHGSTQSFAPATGSDGDSGPSGAGRAPHETWRTTYAAAEDDRARQRAINGARAALAAWRGGGHRPDRSLPSDAAILDERILEAKGWRIEAVAVELRCTPTRIRKVRLAAGRDAVWGLLAPLPDGSDPVTRVRELGARGLTERQMGLLTGLATSTVRRLLGRAA